MATQPRKLPTSSVSPRRLLMYAGILVVVVALLWAAFSTTPDSSLSVEEVAGNPTVDGPGLPGFVSEAGDPAIGATAPQVVGADFDGRRVTIGDGGAEIVVFLASWCPSCQAEVPKIVQWVGAGNLPENVRLTAVATLHDRQRGNWPPQTWLQRENWPAPVLVDDVESSVAGAYGLSGTPYTVAIRDGEIVARIAGPINADGFNRLVGLVS